jgi:hypothetical protein
MSLWFVEVIQRNMRYNGNKPQQLHFDYSYASIK